MVRLTKIIATLGPASGSKKVIRNLVAKGVDIFRLNLSHGDHETVRQWIHWIREVESERHTYIGILLDLQGPKIRVGKFEQGSIHLKRGQTLTFTTEKKWGMLLWCLSNMRIFTRKWVLATGYIWMMGI